MNVNQFRGLGLALIPSSPRQRRLEESLFKFFQCFVEPDSGVQHFLNESFESVSKYREASREINPVSQVAVTFVAGLSLCLGALLRQQSYSER